MCSSHSYLLQYDVTKSQRVCDECFVILEDKLTTGSASPKITRKVSCLLNSFNKRNEEVKQK